MKLVIYVHCLTFGGAERMATHLANFFTDAGHDVTMVSNSEPGDISYSLRAGVENIVMGVGGTSEGFVDALSSQLRRAGAFRKIIKQLQPDFVISMATSVNVTSAIGCIGLNVINAGREQSYPVTERLAKMKWVVLRKLTYRWLDAVVAQTETTAQWVLSNTSAKKVSVIPNAVVLPLDRSKPVVMPDTTNGKSVLLAVGRLSPEKQFDHLIKAFSGVRESCPDWQLVILGEGESRGFLERLIDELGMRDSVFVPGVVGNVGDWYRMAELCALSSAFEGFPNVIVEAMAHGVPVVSYDCDTGPREIIENEINGLLVTHNSIDDLQDGLLRLMIDAESRRTMSLAASKIVEKLDINIVCDQWLNVFRQARVRKTL